MTVYYLKYTKKKIIAFYFIFIIIAAISVLFYVSADK